MSASVLVSMLAKSDDYTDEGSSMRRRWFFSDAETDDAIREYLASVERVELDGMDAPRSAYDCSGQWWCGPVTIERADGRAVASQSWWCDV